VPIRDEELEQSLRTAAPIVSTDDVFERVVRKRSRRRAVRRIEGGAIAFVLVAALSMAVVLAQDDDDTSRVAAPGGASSARVITGGTTITPKAGTATTPVPVTLDPDEGYLRGPLLVSGATLALAAYDHDGEGFTYPPSRIVQLDTRTFQLEGQTNLKAEILSIANGDGGARWVVTRNPPPKPVGLPDAFLKRIAADGTVVSTLLPFGTDVVGDVVAGAGSVWIPTRDGVLRYDPATARLSSRIELAPADRRSVGFANGLVWVTTTGPGALTLFQPDGSNAPSVGVVDGEGPVLDVLDLTDDSDDSLLILGTDATGRARVGDQGLPAGFSATAISAVDGRVWVEGTVSGAPAVVLVGESGLRTVVLDKGRDASFAWVSKDTVLAVSGGTLLRIDLRK
jgi:hypothetical protein